MSSILKVDQIQNTDGQSALVIASDGSVDGVKYAEESNPSGRTITSTTMSSYEVGTWAPTVGSSGGGFAGTINNVSANYTKIGSTVWVDAFIVVTVTAVGSGYAQIGGLPFTVAASAPFKAAAGNLVGSNGGYFEVNNKSMAWITDYSTNGASIVGTGSRQIMVSGHYKTTE